MKFPMAMIIDIFWVFLDGVITIIFIYVSYIVSLFLATLLSTKIPILEKIVGWGFTLVPKFLSNLIGRPFLTKMVNYISIKNQLIFINTNQSYPSLVFMYSMDSKAPIEFKPIELTAYVYLESALMGKIHWSKHEERESKNKGLINLGLDRHFESDEVPNLKAKSESKVKLNFTPPREIYKTKYNHKWTVETYTTFSTKLGDCTKFFSLTFKIKKSQIEEIEKNGL